VGWLVVEDLVMVLVLVLLPALAGLLSTLGAGAVGTVGGHRGTIGLTLAKVTAFVALMLVVGRRVLPGLLWQVARTGSRSCSRCAWWRWRWAWPSARPSCSACRLRWAPSSPA
jgi:predicted Kef-type K+ transport protein